MDGKHLKMNSVMDNRYNEHIVDADIAKRNGEVWTPPEIIDELFKYIPDEDWYDPTATFFDPTAGSGNILIRMLERRLNSGISKEDAIKTLYGIELEEQNVFLIKERLRTVLGDGKFENHDYDNIIDKNIVCSDFFDWDIENWKPKDKSTGQFELFKDV